MSSELLQKLEYLAKLSQLGADPVIILELIQEIRRLEAYESIANKLIAVISEGYGPKVLPPKQAYMNAVGTWTKKLEELRLLRIKEAVLESKIAKLNEFAKLDNLLDDD